MGRGLAEDLEDFLAHRHAFEADADADDAAVRDGVFSDAAADHAAVDKTAPGDVVLGFDLHDLVGGLQHCRTALFRCKA